MNHKQRFLLKYNAEKSIKTAINQSIGASVKRNQLYLIKDLNLRYKVREFWEAQLQYVFQQFVMEKWNEETYEMEIVKLQNTMNSNFSDLLDFRLSHAQKSISVFFKHLWCLDKIGIPPQCPVDRIILTKANAPIAERSWGKVNNIETHRKKIAYLKSAASAAGFQNIAEWELTVF